MVDILTNLVRGYWKIELWRMSGQTPRRRERVLDMRDPWVHIEYLWYSASKLTDNLAPYVQKEAEKYYFNKCKTIIDHLEQIVCKVRNGFNPAMTQARMEELWWDWFGRFQELLEMCGSSEVRSAIASSSSSI